MHRLLRRWVRAGLYAWLVAFGMAAGAAGSWKGQDWLLPLDSYPWPETSITALLEEIGRQPEAGPAVDAAKLRLAVLYWQLGRYDEATSLLLPLWLGITTDADVIAAAGVLWPLMWSDVDLGKGELLSGVNQLATADVKLKRPMPATLWAALARLVKARQFARALSAVPMAARMDAEWPVGEQPAQYRREDLLMLLLTLRADSVELQDGKSATSPERLDALPALRPWKDAALRRAAVLSDELRELDQVVLDNPKLAAAAWELREASLLTARGRPRDAMVRHRTAAATFQRLGQIDLLSEALAGMVADGLALGTRDALLAAYSEGVDLLALHEERMARMGTAGSLYQVRHFDDYAAVRQLLLRLIDVGAGTSTQDLAPFGEQLVLLADRLQLRPARRQMALLRALGHDAAARQRLGLEVSRAKSILSRAAGPLVVARSKGIARDDLRSGDVDKILEMLDNARSGETVHLSAGDVSAGRPMTAEAGPYVELQAARESIRRLLDGGVRGAIATVGAAELPADWNGLTSGMTAQDAIVMFMDPASGQPMRAAVITADAPPRVVVLPGAVESAINVIVADATASLAANAGSAAPALEKLARMLWRPLGSLPARLTIVPNLILIGLPFEALPVGSGRTVADYHIVRYALGLEGGIGRYSEIASPAAALVLGAVDFQRQQLATLADAGAEVEAVRQLLRQANANVEPEWALPRDGRSLVRTAPGVALVHVATHSLIERVDPMFDGLAFPDDDLLAIELAVSPLRAKLAVLSACGLFSNRGQGSQPVSGVATVALAVVAPQVVTTLWSVESRGTRVFITAFYESLLHLREPAAALADAKRLFRDATRLKSWADAHQEAVDVKALAAPYYWAAFALAVRGGSE